MAVSPLLDFCHVASSRHRVEIVFLPPVDDTNDDKGKQRRLSLEEEAAIVAHRGYRGATLYEILALAASRPDAFGDEAVVAFGTLGYTPARNVQISPVIRRADDGLELGVVYWLPESRDCTSDIRAQIGEFLLASVASPPKPARQPY